MKNFYSVVWTERHSAVVQAKDEDKAVETAHQLYTCDTFDEYGKEVHVLGTVDPNPEADTYLHNHAFDIAFEVIDECGEWREVSPAVILEALKARVAELERDESMVLECTSCFDSFSFHGDLEKERADRYNNYSRAEIKKQRRVA